MDKEKFIKSFLEYKKDKHLVKNRLYYNEKVLYSYGNYFPLCIRFNWGFAVNIEKYSNTTLRQQKVLISILKSENKTFMEFNTDEMKQLLKIEDFNKPIIFYRREENTELLWILQYLKKYCRKNKVRISISSLERKIRTKEILRKL